LEALKPDLVFLTTVFGILDNVRKVALLTDTLERSEELNRKLLGALISLAEDPLSLKVYYEVDLGGPITAGAPSYITDALHLLGLRNVYAFRKEPYFQPDDAETRSLRFDLVLYEPKPERRYDEGKIKASLKERLGDRRVVVLEGDTLAHYGPSLIDEILPWIKRRVRESLQG